MHQVYIIRTKGALGFHIFFMLKNGTYFEYSLSGGLETGHISQRNNLDVTGHYVVSTIYSDDELESRAMEFADKPYVFIKTNCRTFISKTLYDRDSYDWLAIAGVVGTASLLTLVLRA